MMGYQLIHKLMGVLFLLISFLTTSGKVIGNKSDNPTQIAQLQQNFIDLRFGMFIHFNIPTFSGHDWPDPEQSPEVFKPDKLDCNQWADAAVSAGMTYACLTTKHHSGFCIWPTKTTDYSVMSSPFKRDIVKEYVEAFRKRGLKIFLYYSILDTHHNIRPGWIKKDHTRFIKDQLTELLTNYGEIDCLVIDGWDAFWSRISYEDISFEEIYGHVKSLQPNCLVSEHNAGKYPSEELFYTDVKHYEQNAGQIISRETNQLPAQAGIPINKNWFWKKEFPMTPVKRAEFIVNDNLIPLNEAYCNFILNVAPNPDGLIDENVIEELQKIGKLWQHPGASPQLPVQKQPVIASNLAKGRSMNSGWSYDYHISDYAVDDDFSTCWMPSPQVEDNFLEVIFDEPTEVNALGFIESTNLKKFAYPVDTRIGSYLFQYWDGTIWQEVKSGIQNSITRIHHFKAIKTSKVRLVLEQYELGAGISEIVIYNEK